MATNMSQTEVLGFATDLYVAIHDVARRNEMTFDQVISVLARYETPGTTARHGHAFRGRRSSRVASGRLGVHHPLRD
jgi:hypothetical protein